MPLIEIREPKSWQAVDEAISRLNGYNWLVFTSTNAVRFFSRRLHELGSKLSDVKSEIAAVGSSTRAALQKAGLERILRAEESTSEALAIHLLEVSEKPASLRILLPGSNLSSLDPWARLSDAGARIDFVEAYQNVSSGITPAEVSSVLHRQRGAYILFASPSALVNISRTLEVGDLEPTLAALKVVCIGPTTAKTAEKLGLTKLLQPEAPDDSSIVKLICDDVIK